ncbi:MAG TPA: tRNA lysidine(34) synthetase TilS [Kiritimatiellae bacterium]|nr:tRNA lysidine(34) synthetase TilS [Kiritimatiellia bacterium]
MAAAVSGGADSVALLVLLQRVAAEMGLSLYAAHVHHGLRGAEADRDADFVGHLCSRMRVPLRVARVSVEVERKPGESPEEAGRRIRYRELVSIARSFGADCIATAHTEDDIVETVIFHLVRGSGPSGLAGIRRIARIGDIPIVRPLLRFGHAELCDYLRQIGQTWMEDSSNRDPRFARNRIRGELIPWIEKNINPAARENIARLAEIIAEEEQWLKTIVTNLLQSCTDHEGRLILAIVRDLPEAARRRVIVQLLRIHGAPLNWHNVQRIANLVNQGSGTRLDLGMGWWAVRGPDFIALLSSRLCEPAPYRYPLQIGGQTAVPEAGLLVRAEWVSLPGDHPPQVQGHVGEYPAEVYLNGEKCRRCRLAIRSWNPGDRIRPSGMRGSRKLQDIFTDYKLPREERRRVPVLEADGEVIWIAGFRPAEGWQGKGRRVLHVRAEPIPS